MWMQSPGFFFFFHCAMLIFIVLWFLQTIVPNKTIKIKLSCCMLGLKGKKKWKQQMQLFFYNCCCIWRTTSHTLHTFTSWWKPVSIYQPRPMLGEESCTLYSVLVYDMDRVHFYWRVNNTWPSIQKKNVRDDLFLKTHWNHFISIAIIILTCINKQKRLT